MELTDLPGPPRVKNHQGRSRLRPSKKRVQVELDPGAFWAVWEMVEARAKNPSPMYDVFRRAVPALREAYWRDHPNELPPPPPEVRKVARRTRK